MDRINGIGAQPGEILNRGTETLTWGQEMETQVQTLAKEMQELQAAWKGKANELFGLSVDESIKIIREYIQTKIEAWGEGLKASAGALSDAENANVDASKRMNSEFNGTRGGMAA